MEQTSWRVCGAGDLRCKGRAATVLESESSWPSQGCTCRSERCEEGMGSGWIKIRQSTSLILLTGGTLRARSWVAEEWVMNV
jgi:hypothetical protein